MADFDNLRKALLCQGEPLPAEAKVIVNVGAIFTASRMYRGLESFCISLAEGSDVAPWLIRKVAELQTRVVENVR